MADYHPADLLANGFEQIKQAINVNTMIGEPLQTDFGMTIIPVSKVTYGFSMGADASGSQKALEDCQSGGFTVEPYAFLIVQDGNVTIKHINGGESNPGTDKALSIGADMLQTVTEFVNK